MRVFKILALMVMLASVGNACTDLEVTNLNDPDRQRAIQTPGDVESLISGAFNSWFWSYQGSYPNCPLSVAADAHSSSWGNWGMKDSSWEPRVAFNNDPAYGYSGVAESPWGDAYAALAGVKDGLAAISEGMVIEEAGVDVTARAVAFGKFVQAQAMANLAMLYDKAFIIDENTVLEGMSAADFVDSDGMWAAALVKYAEAITAAQSSTFTIPASWVGFDEEWTQDDLVGFIRAFRVRHMIGMPRNVADRAAVDWNYVLTELSDGLPFDYNNYYDDGSASWGWHRNKLHCGFNSGWARMDNRTIGPADVSGAWEIWINAAPVDKQPFDIVTPDSRITEPMQPQTDGSYVNYYGSSPFPESRGIYHFCNYMDRRWDYFSTGYIGTYPDFVEAEVDFIRAEAWYRTSQFDLAREVVNQYRANGDLPPFVTNDNPDGTDMCVPQMPDGSCGDLWEALKYEKRIENFHYGSASEFKDDRGWGDLVAGTWLELPVPGEELLLLLEEIYTFGGNAGNAAPGGGVTPSLIFDFSPEALRIKRQGIEAWRVSRKESPHVTPVRR
ncbi:MAG: hypothetical protein KAJ42_05135 [Gemmatimonadetes bacterium]|nr:hypothetical protein [Gemmatimonadota bacterium]